MLRKHLLVLPDMGLLAPQEIPMRQTLKKILFLVIRQTA